MAACAMTTSAISLGTSSAFAPWSLSSRSLNTISVAPCKSPCRVPMTVRASAAAEEPKAGRREMLASTLLAAGAALYSTTTSGDALAVPIPNAAKKAADEVLKSGSEAINKSPLPQGDGRIEGGLKDINSSRIANQSGVRSSLKESGGRMDGVFGNRKDGAVANNPLGAGKVKVGVENLQGKIQSDVQTAGDKVKSDVASTAGLGKKASRKGLEMAQDKASNAGNQGKGILEDVKDQITDAIPQ